MIQADTTPDTEDRLAFDIARKAADADVSDIIGNYSFFGHWLGWYERYGNVGWGTLEVHGDGNAVATWVEEDGNESNRTTIWTFDDVNAIMHVSGHPDGLLCEGVVILSSRSSPDSGGDRPVDR